MRTTDSAGQVPSREETLVEKALEIRSRLSSLAAEADKIHGVLFGSQIEHGEELVRDSTPQIANLTSTLNDISKIIAELEDSLGDTRARL